MPDFDEDFVPASTEYFLPTTNVEQERNTQSEKAKVFNALPLVEEIIEHFDEQITFYSSVDSIPVELHAKPEEFMQSVAANKRVKDFLLIEKGYLEGLLEDYKP